MNGAALSTPALRDAYRAHRAAWRAEVKQWLATRELPGRPPAIDLVATGTPVLRFDPVLGWRRPA